jgi:hypothetical protein
LDARRRYQVAAGRPPGDKQAIPLHTTLLLCFFPPQHLPALRFPPSTPPSPAMVNVRNPFKRQDSISGAVDPSTLTTTQHVEEHELHTPEYEKDEKDASLTANTHAVEGGFMEKVDSKDILANGKERPIEVSLPSVLRLRPSNDVVSVLLCRTDGFLAFSSPSSHTIHRDTFVLGLLLPIFVFLPPRRPLRTSLLVVSPLRMTRSSSSHRLFHFVALTSSISTAPSPSTPSACTSSDSA